MSRFPNPLVLAAAHQNHMHKLTEEIHANAGGIRQLLVGRVVRRKEDGVEFTVREARLGIGAYVSLYGRRTTAVAGRGERRLHRIGLVSDIDLVEGAKP